MRQTRLREILFLVTFWTLAAFFIVTFEGAVREFQPIRPGLPYSYARDITVVLLVTIGAGTAMACFEVLYLSQALRKRPFGTTLLVKTGFFLSCIIVFTTLAVFLIQSGVRGRPPWDAAVLGGVAAYWSSARSVLGVVYWGFVVLFSLFVLQVSEKFGQGVLINFLLGRYHRPKQERRIFMFMDLKSSTTYAEQLGHIRYSRLIQDCFYDLTDVVADHGALIYQYVGDEVVLTWDLYGGIEGGNCIRIFDAYDEALQGRATHYETEYGFVPEFKAGLNAGLVTVAEVGEIKKELAYHGDVLNTAARIQGKCNALGRRLLVSEELRTLVGGRSGYEFTLLGETQLKGKTQPVRIYGARATNGSRREPA
jgi:adenylate cyclase